MSFLFVGGTLGSNQSIRRLWVNVIRSSSTQMHEEQVARYGLRLNCIGALAKMTEMAVKLYRLNGTRVSRALTFAKPSDQALREFLES